MKKIVYIISIAVLTVFASCSKESDQVIEENINNIDSARQSFVVMSPETKTTLDGRAIKWAAGDEIRVVGYSAGEPATTGEAVFELTSGAGTGKAVFTIKDGESLGSFDSYYAIYPASLSLVLGSLPTNLEVSSSTKLDLTAQTAVENGFDPNFAIMTAVESAGTLTFRHGVAYIGVQIPVGLDGVTDVHIGFGANVTGNRPIYTASTGDVSSVQGGTTAVKASGSFVAGSYYYLPAPARATNPVTVTITFTKGGVERSKTTSSLAKVRLETGKVYDLGCPPISFDPVFTASDVNIEAADEAGTIDFTVSNLVDGGVVSKEVLAGATISNLSLGAVSFNTSTGVGSVSFTCDENTESDPKTATVRLTYTYNTDQTVTKDVTITQKKASSGGSVDYVWDFASTEWQDALEDQALAAKGTNNSSWSVTYDDLTFTAGGSNAKWDPTYITTGGNGSKTKRVFTFTATVAGTLSVWSSNTSNSEDTSRKVNVVVGTGDVDTQDGGAASSSPAKLDFDIAAGDVYIYTTNSLRIYKIEFHE